MSEHEDKSAMLLALLDKHQYHPDEVVLVGDARDDITAANVAGIRVVLVVGASLERIDAGEYDASGIPVADSLAQAATLARSLTTGPSSESARASARSRPATLSLHERSG
jgi:phosphoglycolate phosphatase-like HAD superfamily hydrolase